MDRSTRSILTLIVTLLAGAGCRVPYLELRDVSLPQTSQPTLRHVALGRRAVLVSRTMRYRPGDSARSISVWTDIFPPETTVRGEIAARGWVGQVRATGEIRSNFWRPRDEPRGFTVDWVGTGPSPDTMEIRISQLCLGETCEDVTFRVPIDRADQGGQR